MFCEYQNDCGGCLFRNLPEEQYRTQKLQTFKKIMSSLSQKNITFGEAFFIGDNKRRRAEFSFEIKGKTLLFGYNKRQTHDIADITKCLLLCENINLILSDIRDLLKEFCAVNVLKKEKGGKKRVISVKKGQIFITSCANGIDICLEIAENPELEHRLLIADFVNTHAEIISFSYKNQKGMFETIVQKVAPFINIADYQIRVPSASFMQASDQSEKALIALVQKYMADTTGNIADLFCGMGTFSYPLSKNIKNKITAVDSSAELLEVFQKNINANEIPNIKTIKRNLFKYPLEDAELKGFSAIVFDPPRAGANAQIKAISVLKHEEKPQKIIAVSCNPHTFVNDANVLLDSGYYIEEITMVDQFNYSNHTELVALFEKN